MKQLMLFLGCIIALAGTVNAQKSEVFKTGSDAIRGYDAVAYFTEGKPVKGVPEFAYQWKDAKWYFTSRKNLETFSAHPEQYAPQFGGYCAFGTAGGHKAPTDPAAWTIVDGKLYLNYNNDVKKMWVKDTIGYIKKANEQWVLIKDKE
jgi:YHS domain-containing protein